MIYKDILNEIYRERKRGDFVYPYYGRYSIAEIGPSLLQFFGCPNGRSVFPTGILDSTRYKQKKVLMLMVDGLAYHHFLAYHEQMPFLADLETHGEVFPITSVFPSTTPAALTAIHTGLTPQEHGLPEWFVYFDELEGIVETLPFKMIRTHEPNSLLKAGGTTQMLYDGRTVYELLSEAGIKCYNFIYHEYAHGAYQSATNKGSAIIPFTHGSDLTSKLQEAIREEKGPAYFFVYWQYIDSVAHSFGPQSKEHVEELSTFAALMEKKFLPQFDKSTADDVLVLLTADHGHSNIKGEDIIFLNKFEWLAGLYQSGPSGQPIHPTGAPHDVILFIKPDLLGKTVERLKQELEGKADVIKTEEAMSLGLFGLNEASQKFVRRVGNALILPYPNYHVWYDHFPDNPYGLKGVHGGLSEEEMVVPFIVCPLNSLLG